MSDAGFLAHALLAELGVAHGFGTRAARPPRGLRRPRQVHGSDVIELEAEGPEALGPGDAVVSVLPGMPVGVVTADCVPILIAAGAGAAVAAVHAGWRGLARGVVARATERLAVRAGTLEDARAVVGPHVGPCCYEVDAPVVEALRARFPVELEAALRPSRPGHWHLDLGMLAALDLERAGIAAARVARLHDACTACDRERFHSYRRDGPRAGRLVHFVTARAQA